MDRSKSREYTKDEIINLIFEDIDSVLRIYEKNGSEKNSLGKLSGSFIGVCVMNALDGTPSGYPYMELAVIEERVDIHGVLHSLFLDSDERIEKLLRDGVITETTAGFVRRVKALAESYDQNPDMEVEELVTSIFDIVDNGIEGKELKLSVFGFYEDKYEAISYGENYFPVQPLTISGELGKRYRERYLKSKENEREGDLIMSEESKEISKEQMIDEFLTEISELVNWSSQEDDDERYNENGKLKGIIVAHCVLSTLDGNNPGIPEFNLRPASESDGKMNGFLSHMLYEVDEDGLNEYVKNGRISSVTRDFITKIRSLIKQYDDEEITFSNELVAQILELIDNGIDGKALELMAGGRKEDIEDAIKYNYEYYPKIPVNIAGDLASKYREEFLPTVHVYTKEEMVDMLLYQVLNSLKYWDEKTDDNRNSNGVISGSFVTHIILSTLDGGTLGLPYFDLLTTPDEERINSETHSIKNHSVETIRGFVEDGTLSKAKADFILEIKRLEESYDNGEIGTYNDLALKVFEMIDNGFGEHECVLEAGTEVDEQIDYDNQFNPTINVFPTDYPIISGGLVERAEEIIASRYQADKKEDPIVESEEKEGEDNPINAKKALNVALSGQDRVTPKYMEYVRKFFKLIGRMFGGGSKDDR